MLRSVIAAIAAMIITSLPLHAGETNQLVRYMWLDDTIVSKSQQAHDKGTCRVPEAVPYTTGQFLIDLRKINGVMNAEGLDVEEKQQQLQKFLPTGCVLLTRAERQGAILEVLTIVTKAGDMIVSDFEDEVWTWNDWCRTHGFTILDRQDPRDPNRFVKIVRIPLVDAACVK